MIGFFSYIDLSLFLFSSYTFCSFERISYVFIFYTKI